MEDKKNRNKALVRLNNSNLIKVGNVLEISKKLISQGHLVAQDYSKIKLIPYNKEEKWYLYNISEKLFLNTAYKYTTWNEDYILCLDYNDKYSLFKGETKLFEFEKFFNEELNFCPSFVIADNNKLILWWYTTHWQRYIPGVLNLKGEIIDCDISQIDLNTYSDNREKNDISIKDTLWKVNSDGLYYKDQQIINGKQFYELSINNFHYGFALVEDIFDVCPEFGVTKSILGYIDVFGNHYWDKLQPTYEN